MDGAVKTQYVPAVTRIIAREDYDFVYHSWLKSYRQSWPRRENPVRFIPKEIYYQNQKEIIAYLLENSYTIIAHNPEDPDHIFGYIVCQPTSARIGILHYCFVKQPFRGLGIGGLLLNEARNYTDHDDDRPMVATHGTALYHDKLTKKYNILFNPYLVYRSLIDEDKKLAPGKYGQGW